MSPVQPNHWNFMTNHGLPGSLSEQGHCLDRQHGLPGTFSEQIRDLARPQRSLFSTADGHIDHIGNGGVPLDEKVVDESHKNAAKFANKSRKRKPAGLVPFSVDVGRNSEPSQKRHCGQSASFSEAIARQDPTVEIIDLTIEVIDLTVNVEHCAICPNILGHGQGYISRMFAFTTCGCVLCGECLLGNKEKERESTSVIKDVCCPKSNHFNKGKQEARQIFGLECAICYATSADGFDQGAPHRSDMVRTSCGAFDSGL
ncbi:hypothetical protein BKA64DRAFT_701255 [Cadophora sp. MPI-SDFR-AT-0126]|nr:hypothetical protein BKA64DRAFT_701255 [Leotiomycetes sp. MPI-SDFR-AT-0126]